MREKSALSLEIQGVDKRVVGVLWRVLDYVEGQGEIED